MTLLIILLLVSLIGALTFRIIARQRLRRLISQIGILFLGRDDMGIGYANLGDISGLVFPLRVRLRVSGEGVAVYQEGFLLRNWVTSPVCFAWEKMALPEEKFWSDSFFSFVAKGVASTDFLVEIKTKNARALYSAAREFIVR